MYHIFKNTIKSKWGPIIISMILGFGLASLFRKDCTNNKCVQYVAPKINEIKKNIYKYNSDCYKFNTNTQECKSDSPILTA